jgi:hypothetical protein
MDLYESGYPIIQDALRGFSQDSVARLNIQYGRNVIAVDPVDGSAASQNAVQQAVVRLNSAFRHAGWEHKGEMSGGRIVRVKYRPQP